MADKDLTVHLKADDKITPAAKKAASALDKIPDRVETTVDVDSSGVDDLTSKLGDLPGLLGQLGGAGAAGGVGALAAGLFAAANSAKDLALEAQTTADLTGAAVEETSKLQQLWKTSGADVNDLNDVLLQMNGALAQSPELAKQLGVNLNDGKNIQQRFVELTGKLADGQLTAVQASQLFGEEGVRQVGKLRTVYGGLADDIEDMPAPVSDEDVKNALEMERAMNKLKAAVSATVGEFGQRLVPLFADLAELADKATAALPGGADAQQVSDFYYNWATGIGVVTTAADLLNKVTGDSQITATFDESSIAASNYAAGVDAAAEATTSLGVGLDRMGIVGHEALQKVDDDAGDARDAIDDVTFAADAASEGFKRLRTQVDMKETVHRFQVDFLTATAKIQGGVALTGDEILGLENDILSVAEFANLNPVQVQSLIDAVEHGDVAGVMRLVQNQLDADPAQWRVNLVLGRISPDLASIRQAERSATVNVTSAGARSTGTATGLTATPAATVAPAALSPITIRVPAPVVPTININAGVVGNRFDTQRTVAKTLRAHQRLNGVRP